MAIEKNNPELIDLEIEQGVEQEITSPITNTIKMRGPIGLKHIQTA